MSIQDKWGNKYLGFMLITGAANYRRYSIELNHAQATAAMATIDEAYINNREAFNKDLELFKQDLKDEEVSMKTSPHHQYKRPTTMSVGEKLLAIWQG